MDGNNKSNVFAILALVASIISLVIALIVGCCVPFQGVAICMGGPFGIASIVFIILSFVYKQSTGMTIASIICTVLSVVVVIVNMIIGVVAGGISTFLPMLPSEFWSFLDM